MKKYALLFLLTIFLAGCEKDFDNVIDVVFAPVISDVRAPDTVKVTNLPSVIFMSIKVNDGNGLSDIRRVYFTTIRPDGTSSGNKTNMSDDGNVDENGDQTAGDGIYSVIIQVTPSNEKGIYKFDFRAEDTNNQLSNVITHNIEIQ